MVRCSIATGTFLAAAALTAAAPVPAPSEREQIQRLWGTIVSPSEQTEFKLDGKLLTIRTDGRPSRGLGDGERSKAPRVTRTVMGGDFEVTVRVTSATPPRRDGVYQDSWPWSRAGIFVTGGGYSTEFHLSQFYIKRAGNVVSEDLTRCVWVDSWFKGGGSGSQLARVDPEKSAYLRITRRGKAVSVSHSTDGKEWSAPYTPRQEMDFPEEVTVGVFVTHGTTQIMEATFADLTVGKPAPKPEKK